MEHRLDEFSALNLANTAWAFAKMGHLDGRLLAVLALAAELAFSKMGHLDKKQFTVLALATECRLDEFDAPNLANTA